MLDRHAVSMMVKYRGQFISLEAYRQMKRERVKWALTLGLALLVYWFVILPAVARIVERWVR